MPPSTLSGWLWVPRPRRKYESVLFRRQATARRRAAHRRRGSGTTGEAFEIINVTDRARFVRNCQRFLPDPLTQAGLDIPRMRVTVDGRRADTLAQLLTVVPRSQGAILATLCNQALFGAPYQLAIDLMVTSLPEGKQAVVCEDAPARPGYITLQRNRRATDDNRRVGAVIASKKMRGGYIATDGHFYPLCKICLSIDVDLLGETGAVVSAARITEMLAQDEPM